MQIFILLDWLEWDMFISFSFPQPQVWLSPLSVHQVLSSKYIFHCCIWIHHEKWIQVSTNKSSIVQLILTITSCILRKYLKTSAQRMLELKSFGHLFYHFAFTHKLNAQKCEGNRHWCKTKKTIATVFVCLFVCFCS